MMGTSFRIKSPFSAAVAIAISASFLLAWTGGARADTILDPIWPDEVGYGGSFYQLLGSDPENLGLPAEQDLLGVDWARDDSETNDYFFFRLRVRDQKVSQLTSAALAVFLDRDADGTFDYVLYNTGLGSDESELAYWNTSEVAWDTDAQPPAYVYSGGTRDADTNDNFIELAGLTSHIGGFPWSLQMISSAKGNLDMDGDTFNYPDPEAFSDITSVAAIPEPSSAVLALLAAAFGVLLRRRRSCR